MRVTGRPYASLLAIALVVLVAIIGFLLVTDRIGTAPNQITDEARIYAAVIRQIYTHDDTFGGTYRAPVLYILDRAEADIPEIQHGQDESRVIPLATRKGIQFLLKDLPTLFVWTDSIDHVTHDPKSGRVAYNGMVVFLGKIEFQPDGKVQVTAGSYVSALMAGGRTYVLEQVDGAWTITGTTGSEWIS